ncbi:DUF1329 domain-containing protein [Massilia dura]|uniref:DUF1329 domain-containing protein n=1 Tax=Pseudoduganella dura TaxID=321982 RepID=A0A6I3X9T6_9BURK|nr:DUF1329 domain-containing protein [Pseudoduganella dura]MUI11370.1 DUF1329 domain-containing protein [Pseudoduganella dura]GGX95710.1 hypothetical protein GCM10007386_28290 [Pseudoduganella dura]
MKPSKCLAALTALICELGALHAYAATPEEAAKLKTTLTPLGAERAGNADGSIPAWTGDVPKPPGGLKAGSVTAAPFADEKPLYQINAANMDKYAGKLSEATKHLMKTYPDYRLDVYPTHRTATAPQSVYDNTFKNATNAKLAKGGLAVEGAYGGLPFPIPKSGIEAIWNLYLSWKGVTISTAYNMWLITSDGKRTLASTIDITEQYPYYSPQGNAGTFNGVYWEHKGVTTAPSRSVGEAIIGVFSTDFKDKEPGSWQYLPGQRRVRKIPNVSYDTPNFYMSGVTQFDESYGFFGKPDQMDFTIVGKREMYVPYNTNKFNATAPEQAFGPSFPKPENVRWELHRVWEVDVKLKPGMRNVVPKRKLYFDEDTWSVLLADEWDAQGKLYRGLVSYPFVSYDLPGVIALPFVTFDFQARAYSVAGFVQNYKSIPYKPAAFFNPDSMVQDALR